ncbi:MAG TPA: phage tail protein I [Candidatus Sulfomarinibacteraceae bacterium]|nr:phage tail protein I [Candidatus Sulfomarinibacteraceae bacterium]
MAETVRHQLKISGPQMSTTFVVPQGKTTIGRHADNDLNFIHPLVSRHHAQLECEGNTCTIVDLGSTHGTNVNRQMIEPDTPIRLEPSDVIEIGAFWMLYERIDLGPPPAPAAPPETESPQQPGEESDAPPEPAPLGEAEEGWDSWEGWDVDLDAPPASAMDAPDDWEATAIISPSAMGPAAPPPRRPRRPPANGHGNDDYTPPPGLSLSHSNYIKYLPDIYWGNGNDFIIRFLALLESILAPIKWNVDNFDLFLDPRTAPADFLPWLAGWFDLAFDESWSEESRRALLADAHKIYSRRGTVWALRHLLEIYTGKTPEIDDTSPGLDPFTFLVRIPLPERQVNRTVIERLIDANKPAHTSYQLLFQE